MNAPKWRRYTKTIRPKTGDLVAVYDHRTRYWASGTVLRVCSAFDQREAEDAVCRVRWHTDNKVSDRWTDDLSVWREPR